MENLEQLSDKVTKLAALLNASLELNSDIDLMIVLQKVLNVMCSTLQAEAGTLWILDEDRSVISAEVANGPMAHQILEIKLQQGEGVVGRVITNNRSELVEDVTKDTHWAKRVDKESGFITRSLMTVPISIKQNVLGAIQLVNKTGKRFFNEEDVEIAEALASQSALAIHNSQMFDELERFSNSVIHTLTLALDARDPYTAGHSSRVGLYSLWIARKMGMDEQACKQLERLAIMHDIGKISIPDNILGKPSRLSDNEFDIMKKHPEHGAKILSRMEPKKHAKIARLVARHHHEKYDGSGYPDRLSGEAIPLYARIVAVSDAFDAMTTVRPYSNGRSYKEGVEEIVRCKGMHFDPQVVDAFSEVMHERNYLINNRERTKMNESV